MMVNRVVVRCWSCMRLVYAFVDGFCCCGVKQYNDGCFYVHISKPKRGVCTEIRGRIEVDPATTSTYRLRDDAWKCRGKHSGQQKHISII